MPFFLSSFTRLHFSWRGYRKNPQDRELLFIYLLFNRFHHDYSAKKDKGKNTFEQDTKTRDEGAGHTTERGFKLSVPLRKMHKY